ncbi:MAG: hypothetical protein AAGI07_11480 [Bacteroidota bacterium]
MKSVLLLLLLFISVRARSQSVWEERIEFIEAGLFIHSISIPFKASNGFLKLNRLPGLRVGASIPINDNKLGLAYRPSLSFYHQKKLHYGWHFNNQFALSYLKHKQFSPEALAGIGYLHTFEDAALYKIDKGKVNQKRDWGRAQFTISLGLGIGWRFSKTSQWAAFAQHEVLLQWPFATKGEVAFIVHNRTHIGLRKFIGANTLND